MHVWLHPPQCSLFLLQHHLSIFTSPYLHTCMTVHILHTCNHCRPHVRMVDIRTYVHTYNCLYIIPYSIIYNFVCFYSLFVFLYNMYVRTYVYVIAYCTYVHIRMYVYVHMYVHTYQDRAYTGRRWSSPTSKIHGQPPLSSQ